MKESDDGIIQPSMRLYFLIGTEKVKKGGKKEERKKKRCVAISPGLSF